MFALSHKAKQYGLIALKVFLLGFAFHFIYQKVTNQSQIGLDKLWEVFESKPATHLLFTLLFIGMSWLNWSLEILKWKTIVGSYKHITFWEALKQCLASLTVSLATPNRIGDYGAKVLFYSTGERKKILLLNFISSTTQMLVTSLFGVIGLAVILIKYELYISLWKIFLGVSIICLLFLVGNKYKERNLLVKGLSIKKVYDFIKNLSSLIKIKVVMFSLFRYVTFCSLFYMILIFLDTEISVKLAAPLIATMYLLVSIIPSIFIFDVVVRGGIAVWLFSLEGISEWPVLLTVLSMWILNFALPAIWGSAYVITFQPIKS